MSDDTGVVQPAESPAWALVSMRCDRTAASCALDVDAPYQMVSGVAGVSGKLAKP
jgi:hypothetical protein